MLATSDSKCLGSRTDSSFSPNVASGPSSCWWYTMLCVYTMLRGNRWCGFCVFLPIGFASPCQCKVPVVQSNLKTCQGRPPWLLHLASSPQGTPVLKRLEEVTHCCAYHDALYIVHIPHHAPGQTELPVCWSRLCSTLFTSFPYSCTIMSIIIIIIINTPTHLHQSQCFVH